MPKGKHSRTSDVHSHMVATAGCGTAGPAILGPAKYDATKGAKIQPVGRHSRMSDVHSYIVNQAGCGAERTPAAMPSIVEEEPSVDEEELARARAPTVEQVPVPPAIPQTVYQNVHHQPPAPAVPK